MDETRNAGNDAPESNGDALPISQTQPSVPPLAGIQQNIGAEPPDDKRGGSEAEHQQPLPVRVINDPLLTRIVEDDELSTFEHRTLQYARWGFGIAIVTLVIAVVTGLIFYGQFAQMANQTDFLSRASKQARIAAKDAGIIATKQLGTAQEQASAAQNSADAIKSEMRQDKRAWLVPTYDNVVLKYGQPIGQVFHYTNIGKTPAKAIKSQFIMKIVHDADSPAFDYPKKIVTRNDINVLFPTLREHLAIPLFVADKYPLLVVYANDIKRQYEAGDIMFLTYGEIGYYDVYRVHHWVHYCTMTFSKPHTTTPTVATKCNEYTQTDDE